MIIIPQIGVFNLELDTFCGQFGYIDGWLISVRHFANNKALNFLNQRKLYLINASNSFCHRISRFISHSCRRRMPSWVINKEEKLQKRVAFKGSATAHYRRTKLTPSIEIQIKKRSLTAPTVVPPKRAWRKGTEGTNATKVATRGAERSGDLRSVTEWRTEEGKLSQCYPNSELLH